MPPMKEMFSLFLVTVTSLGLGCTGTGVSIRPDGSPGPQACPEKALETMKILRLRPGDSSTVELDANQSGQSPISVNDGPVESILKEDFGYLPPVTRLYGQIWTGGPNVVIRYYEARPPDGERILICAVARLGRGGLLKKPGPRPGSAVLDFSRSGVYIVDDFR
ncbi:serine/threonine protein kinase [Stigmatella sp. ncwal1]|uniref:Serine/threonine protein kinase n=1 Tax=Stigmatella ashevillensis TaxID=2995309 RepID=A0ABT5DD02_9BACT|nr:serine/threonine protein kinase [Stigmatella ashevillena]MDC0711552.1 serine/threonine protein kinase [Stigmatella ashevillena]